MAVHAETLWCEHCNAYKYIWVLTNTSIYFIVDFPTGP